MLSSGLCCRESLYVWDNLWSHIKSVANCREKHKMKLLSPGITRSHAHELIVHSRHCYRCCSRHRNEWVDLWEQSSCLKVVCLLGNQLHLWPEAQTDREHSARRTGASFLPLDRHSVLVWPLKSGVSPSLHLPFCFSSLLLTCFCPSFFHPSSL